MNDFLEYSHDRSGDYLVSCIQLRDLIDNFVNRKEWDSFYIHFEKNYQLPKTCIKQWISQRLESYYHHQKACFSKNLYLRKVPKYSVLFIALLTYIRIYSKPTSTKQENYELLIDQIETPLELERFSPLIKMFPQGSVAAIATNSIDASKSSLPIYIHSRYSGRYKGYDREAINNCIYVELRDGIYEYVRLSKLLGLNVFIIAAHILNDYLYYHTIFNNYISKYCIQERHYGTNAIKNHLFKTFGGTYSTCIQKNIHQRGRNGYYYDIDVMFSLGKRTADRSIEFGARIDSIVPVGSMFMQNNWFDQKVNISKEKQFDVVFMGMNISINNYFIDTYDLFQEDYYNNIRWLVQLSQEFPKLKICIKHHSNTVIDLQEAQIMRDSNIIQLSHEKTSYEIGFLSRSVVTYGSTIGYELMAHGVPVLFMDPGKRCAYMPDDDFLLEYRMVEYHNFRKNVLGILNLSDSVPPKLKQSDDICMQSDKVGENIYQWFKSNS